MAIINPTQPSPGSPRGGEETDVRNVLTAILALVNGQLDGDNIANNSLGSDELTAALRDALGLSSTGVVRRGQSIIATEEARTNVAYGLLTTPDQVANVVVPTGGLLFVVARAAVKSSGASTGQMAVMLNGVQSQTPNAAIMSAATSGTDSYATSWSNGSGFSTSAGPITDVTTGMVAAVPLLLKAAAGTYTVSLQFKASSGSVTAKNRELSVWTLGS